MSMLRTAIRLAGMAAIAALAFGAGAMPSQAETVKVGIVNASSDAPFFIAEAKGYFKDEGLTVDLIPFASAAKMVAPLGIGELDAGGGGVSAGLYNAVARGVGLKIVADKAHISPGYSYASLLVRKDLVTSGKFKDYKGLKGLKVAISGIGGVDESVLNQALKRGGLKWGDADVVPLGFRQHPAAYKNGAIDASITNEPTLTYILRQGTAVRFAYNEQFYPDEQTAVLIYGDLFIKKRRATAEKFIRAYLRGVRYYNDALKDGHLAGPAADDVINILVKYSSLKDAAVYRAITPQASDPDGKVSVAGLQKDWTFFKDHGEINGKVTVDDIVDPSFAKKAVAELGPYRPQQSGK
jgi:NitT/TauT family transport system substrate-binding protein